METVEQELTLTLHCRNLPGTQCDGRTAVRLGIQRGKEVIEDVPADSEEAHFTLSFRVLLKTPPAEPDFRGAFVQGKVGERFLYFCWGERVGQAWAGVRRAKLPLRQIPLGLLRQALHEAKPLHAFLDMTDDRGEPLTASIKDGVVQWRLSE